MTASSRPPHLTLGDWIADRMTCRISGPDGARAVEPKVMDLLLMLGAEPGRVFTRPELLEKLWPGVLVGDDVIARAVFKLRAALRDGPGQACRIETIPKRGYRLVLTGISARPAESLRVRRRPKFLLPLAASVLIGCLSFGLALPDRAVVRQNRELVERARDAYFQYTRADNDAAITLFERAVADDPDNAAALAGLSSALVQRVLRWPAGADLPAHPSPLQHALRTGRLESGAIRPQLVRAISLADSAARLDPNDPDVLRARGLALAALNRRDEAATVYRHAIRLDRHAWGSMINLADLLDLEGRPDRAAEMMARAYDSMSMAYAREPARIRPWFAAVGLNVARRRLRLGDSHGAARWYARTLEDHPQAAHLDEELHRMLASNGPNRG